jgi:hypothetical protein
MTLDIRLLLLHQRLRLRHCEVSSSKLGEHLADFRQLRGNNTAHNSSCVAP